MMRFTEETGAALDTVTFLVFGAVLLGPVLEHVSWQIALYAVLSLTIVRMLPVAISLWGTHALGPTVAFMGWFGPRGLASIVFAVMVEDAHLAHAPTIVAATYLTVGLSVLVHGLSAAPLVSRYANWYKAAADKLPPAMESTPMHEHRTRGPRRALPSRPSVDRRRTTSQGLKLMVGRGRLGLQLSRWRRRCSSCSSVRNQYANHGQRVGEGQWLMQAASDIMLGWYRVTGIDELRRDFYFRQLWDEKGSALIEGMEPELGAYAEICGRTLAHAHARPGMLSRSAPTSARATRWTGAGRLRRALRRPERNGPRRAERRRQDRARQSADGGCGPHQRLDSNHPIWMIGIPGAFGDHPSRRVHNSCRFKDTQISRITTCRGPGNC